MNRGILAQCEREALHLSGAIEPGGTLLMLDEQGLVSHVAANLGQFLDLDPASLLGRPVPESLRDCLAGLGPNPGTRRVLEAQVAGRGGMLDLLVVRGEQGNISLELFPHLATAPASSEETSLQAPVGVDPNPERSRDALLQWVVEQSGFQRVMFYRFHDNGDGEVIAERRQGDVYGSYLGLRFPASDIPQIARTLYQKHPWRMIADARAEPVPLLGRDEVTADLTWADLRSVSPVHRVYLANMGVRASLSLPLAAGGQLLALVTAHHSEPCRLPLQTLDHLASLARRHALEIIRSQSGRRMRLIDNLTRQFDAVLALLQKHGDLSRAWPEVGAWLMQEFKVDGALFRWGDICVGTGTCLEPDALDVFDNWFCRWQDEVLWFGDSLARQVPNFPHSLSAGVLAVRVKLGDREGPRVFLCRMEHLYEVAWGGNPDKPVEFHDGNLGIAPRHSFEKWVEKRLGYSRPWDNEARLLALKLRDFLQRLLFK